MYVSIPAELRKLDQWVVANADKIPLNPRSLKKADVTNPETWGTFEHACNAGLRHVGFVLSKDDPYTIIDLDSPVDERQAERHSAIYEAFKSYTELSQSGNGVHIIVRGKIPNGVRRDKVEIYSDSRYMICTGKVLKPFPIVDCQTLLDGMYVQMHQTETTQLVQVDGHMLDDDLLLMATNAANGNKFTKLWAGEWQELGYPSQSEADFSLLSMLAFYSKDNEQVRRLFRACELGKRDKAQRNDKYLNFALSKVRAKEPPTADLSQLLKSNDTETTIEPGESPDSRHPDEPRPDEDVGADDRTPEGGTRPDSDQADKGVTFPPGFVGDVASYILASAIRPVPEIALAAAIALTAGVVGRAYNVSGSGLNQYLILLAKTGSGKEGAATGIDALVTAVRSQCPMVDEFIGPGAFASGQALVRVLDKKPCFVSVLGEFGLTLQQLCDPKANQAQLMLKKVLLDIYAKSGFTKVLRSSVYSEVEKNTQIIQAPNVTILGEATPEGFYAGLDASAIAEGLIPRFSILEYLGPRPAKNPRAFEPPPKALVDGFAELLATALAAQQNRAYCDVLIDEDADLTLELFDQEATDAINQDAQDVARQLWNRAHLKALKLAALIAVGVNAAAPVVTGEHARWAIHLVREDIRKLLEKFKQGDTGQGDLRMESDCRRAIDDYLRMSKKERAAYSLPAALLESQAVPISFLSRRLRTLSAFRNDRRGANAAFEATLKSLCEASVLERVSPVQALQYGTKLRLYIKGDAW